MMDESVVVDSPEAFTVAQTAKPPAYQIVQTGRVWDLSKINFARLKEEFRYAPYKNIEIADLRAFINGKITQMLQQNMTRTDFAQKLQEIKKAATSASGVYLVPREDTLATLQRLGLTKKNLEEILLSLSVADYCSGPEADRDREGQLWIFGKRLRGHEIYIKLKVAMVAGKKIAKCISFHIAKYPLSYPCKKSG